MNEYNPIIFLLALVAGVVIGYFHKGNDRNKRL